MFEGKDQLSSLIGLGTPYVAEGDLDLLLLPSALIVLIGWDTMPHLYR